MKKNDWILLVSVLCYSYLFYEQFAGINFLVFNIVLLATLFIKDRSFLTKKALWLPLVGSIVSAVCIALYGDGLSVFANICSLVLLASKFVNQENSLATSFIHGGFSVVSAPINMIIDGIHRSKRNKENRVGEKRNGVLFYIIPLAVSLVFFIFYRNSSALFKNLTDQIRFDFISIKWVFFTVGGLILTYGFYYSKKIARLFIYEQSQQDGIIPSGKNVVSIIGNSIDIDTERRSGIMMLGLLNFLILVVNVLDIKFLVFGGDLPQNFNYSAMVHEGINSLILSIITAIAIILWYFRGEQNYSGNNILRVLAYIWIAQNVLMIVTSAYKNGLYIEEWALTYKRIGVFVYLLLASLGLITTAIKIRNIKSNWYLLKINIVGAYIALLLGCLVNWDLFIVRYNIHWSEMNDNNDPIEYTATLSRSVMPDLYNWSKTHSSDSLALELKEKFQYETLKITEEQSLVDWRSWSFERNRIASEMLQ